MTLTLTLAVGTGAMGMEMSMRSSISWIDNHYVYGNGNAACGELEWGMPANYSAAT